MTTVSATPLLGTINGGYRIVAVVPAINGDHDLYVTGKSLDVHSGQDVYVTWSTMIRTGDHAALYPRRVFNAGRYFTGGTSQGNKSRALADMVTRAGIVATRGDD